MTEAGGLPGPIFVFGDPLYYFVSGRRQAIPVNGWFMEVALAEQWREMARQLGDARPPYIFVATLEADLIRRHSDEIGALLATAYRELRRSRVGTWYVRAPAEPPGTSPADQKPAGDEHFGGALVHAVDAGELLRERGR